MLACTKEDEKLAETLIESQDINDDVSPKPHKTQFFSISIFKF